MKLVKIDYHQFCCRIKSFICQQSLLFYVYITKVYNKKERLLSRFKVHFLLAQFPKNKLAECHEEMRFLKIISLENVLYYERSKGINWSSSFLHKELTLKLSTWEVNRFYVQQDLFIILLLHLGRGGQRHFYHHIICRNVKKDNLRNVFFAKFISYLSLIYLFYWLFAYTLH